MLYLGVSSTHQAQTDILEALTRKFRLDPALDLRQLAERCPFNYTGADLYALCSDAMLNAMSRKAEALEQKIGTSSGPRFYLSIISFPISSSERATETTRLSAPHDTPIFPRRNGIGRRYGCFCLKGGF
jgi:SpoVK/Ycf46/Vps4 family AAA+-type ATPase